MAETQSDYDLSTLASQRAKDILWWSLSSPQQVSVGGWVENPMHLYGLVNNGLCYCDDIQKIR